MIYLLTAITLNNNTTRTLHKNIGLIWKLYGTKRKRLYTSTHRNQRRGLTVHIP